MPVTAPPTKALLRNERRLLRRFGFLADMIEMPLPEVVMTATVHSNGKGDWSCQIAPMRSRVKATLRSAAPAAPFLPRPRALRREFALRVERRCAYLSCRPASLSAHGSRGDRRPSSRLLQPRFQLATEPATRVHLCDRHSCVR